jgi:predicted nucleic acid-binding protein
MRALMDSDVLIAGLHERHPRHARALDVMIRARDGEIEAIVATLSIAQTYRVLTSHPVLRLPPRDAIGLIERGLLRHCEPHSLDVDRHLACLRQSADAGIAGGAIYDGLIAEVGRAAKVDKIVTFNVADFRRVAPDLDVVAP